MQILLTQPVDGLGEQYDIVTVDTERELDLLSARKALKLTPLVRKRFSGQILKRAVSPSTSTNAK